MKAAILGLLLSATVPAATVRGIVLDYMTGRPLSRTPVKLEMLGNRAYTARTDHSGVFVFSPLPGGLYLLSASREGFAPYRYGQKYWNSPARPLAIDENGELFLETRMHRLGSVSGTIWDENEVGIPNQPVLVYKAGKHARLVANTRTDDRGIYRLSGLDPGTYFVRNGPKLLEEGLGTLPTLARGTYKLEEAEKVVVPLDGQITDINYRPAQGKLCRVSGKLGCPINAENLRTSLISELGVIGTASGPDFSFDNVPPGDYELLAEGVIPILINGQIVREPIAYYRKFTVERDTEAMTAPMDYLPKLSVSISGVDSKGRRSQPDATVLLRRVDLSGPGATVPVRDPRIPLLPGDWEATVRAKEDLYPSQLYISGNNQRVRADLWTRFTVRGNGLMLSATVAPGPAAVHGKVTGDDHLAPAGAPVFLEPYDRAESKRLSEVRATRANENGDYEFKGLAPGTYRLLSSFEFEDPDPEQVDIAHPKVITVKANDSVTQDLEVFTQYQ